MSVIAPDSDLPLRRVPIAVLDFETTGVDAATCQPVSVSVTHAELGVKGSEKVVLDIFVNPGIPIPAGAAKIHGITDEKVWGKPTFDSVLPQVLEALDSRVLVAFNLPYDWTILRIACERNGIEAPAFGSLDGLPLARVVDKYEKSKKLTDVCKRRGITFDAHQSSADTLAVAQVLPLLLRDLRGRGFDKAIFESVGACWAYTKKAALHWELDYARHTGKATTKPWHDILGVSYSL